MTIQELAKMLRRNQRENLGSLYLACRKAAEPFRDADDYAQKHVYPEAKADFATVKDFIAEAYRSMR
jgi:hypothetical protein